MKWNGENSREMKLKKTCICAFYLNIEMKQHNGTVYTVK